METDFSFRQCKIVLSTIAMICVVGYFGEANAATLFGGTVSIYNESPIGTVCSNSSGPVEIVDYTIPNNSTRPTLNNSAYTVGFSQNYFTITDPYTNNWDQPEALTDLS
jgi:hypothetical protein